ncbi:HPP family protein [Streptomyces cavernicola]|uniref:HPP family protein n=1 Tax=Streptomyces cavernicola TaxID=3043613 RepID=A0ABT6S5F0_9ACTN|nr:HPP family protein [Streptomyces sp. B-S-A6]MDI3403324.1 HPP family protein [Streptomyces sp. B-S-A6]
MSRTAVPPSGISEQTHERAWYESRAPRAAGPRAVLTSTALSVVALTLLAGIGVWLHQAVLIPPLAASMALIAGASASPLAQPRNVVGGHVVAALTGYLVVAVAGAGFWSAAAAGGLALGVMLLFRVSHSPAAATAVIVGLEHPPPAQFLSLLVMSAVLLVLIGLLGNRINRRHYPVYWW